MWDCADWSMVQNEVQAKYSFRVNSDSSLKRYTQKTPQLNTHTHSLILALTLSFS